VPEVVVGVGAGIGSALGLLAAPVAFDFVRSHPCELISIDWVDASRLCLSMADEGRALVRRAGIADCNTEVQISVDLRYQGQGYEIEVDCPPALLDSGSTDELLARFEQSYRARYGHALIDVPVEVVNWRCRVSGPRSPLTNLRLAEVQAGRSTTRPDYTRAAFFDDVGVVADTPVYARQTLAPGTAVSGPCIIEEAESTTVIGTNATATVDESGVLIVKMGGRGRAR
jgi:N-methylhydantoinase A